MDFTTTELIIGLIGWLSWMTINALIAQAKNINVVSTIAASVALSPAIVWLYVAGMPSKPRGSSLEQVALDARKAEEDARIAKMAAEIHDRGTW